MNREIENEIVDMFVWANKRERINWELSNKKKREEVVWQRFCHPDIFDKCVLQDGKSLYLSPKELEDYLFQLGKTRQVYYMGLNYIGEETLEHAIERMESDICLIYLGNGMAFYQEEQDKLPTPRYLLIRKR